MDSVVETHPSTRQYRDGDKRIRNGPKHLLKDGDTKKLLKYNQSVPADTETVVLEG